ncbi:MAG: 4Fe-4S dicluster domain-containing protein [Planctomycetia bacterium]|nr:4Fe-4S dicluster domain-containing protein [Planctomycetia bacterium]
MMLNITLPARPKESGIVEEYYRKKAMPRRSVMIDSENCKGCGLCIAHCTMQVLEEGPVRNSMGYKAAIVANQNCTGCGDCFYICPEPDAIRVVEPARRPSNVSI